MLKNPLVKDNQEVGVVTKRCYNKESRAGAYSTTGGGRVAYIKDQNRTGKLQYVLHTVGVNSNWQV